MIDPTKLRLVIPEYGTDQIIGVTSGTLSVAAPSGFVNTTTSTTFTHSFGDSAYFAGIFSADGGTTWNDFGSMIPVLVGGNPVFQTVGCNATCDTTNLNVTLTSYVTNFTTGTGSAATITYKAYLLAKNTMAAPITPLPTNEKLLYSSDYNFQKIYQRGSSSLVVASGSTGSVTVIHNLGYVPRVRAFRFDSSASTTCKPVANGLVSDPQIRLDSTSLVFYADETGGGGINLNTSLEWRIYLES